MKSFVTRSGFRLSMRFAAFLFLAACASVPFTSRASQAGTDAKPVELTTATGKTLQLDAPLTRVLCSGSGCLRLLTYLGAQDKILAVDDIETRRRQFDARPYALANPQFKKMPVFGEFRGHDNPELILSLDPQPQAIFKLYNGMGHDPAELEAKTGIPVIVLEDPDLGAKRDILYRNLRTMGAAMGKEKRAQELIAFFDGTIADLASRTKDAPQSERKSVYLGGVAYKGPHGFESTEPGYPPFAFVGADNVAAPTDKAAKAPAQTNVSKEQVLAWNPDPLFLDLATMQLGEDAGGLHELRTDPAYRMLDAVKGGRVYGLLPYNWYSENFGSELANAYFIGKLLYPERFEDVDPKAKADEIFSFLVGKPVFADMNALFSGMAYVPVPVN